MHVSKTPIEGLLIIEPRVFNDDRGYFYESYSKHKLAEIGIEGEFVQDNQSSSSKGTLRGLHGQAPPAAQGKLVRVIQGRVWDVAVDIRKSSPTYKQYFGVELSGENHKQFWIPPGFLHAFITLENDTIFTYKVTGFYNKPAEIGLLWNDPALNIQWPAEGLEILVSDKDKILPTLAHFESPFQ